MRKYLISDFLFRGLNKFKDYILKIKWIFILGSIGKGSFIRSGVRIVGNPKRIYIGEKFKVYHKVIIAIGKGELRVGNNGLIGVGTYINCGDEKLTIGDNVAIAPYCKIFTNSHHYSDVALNIISYQNGDVIIEDNVLIGSNTVILPGVKIGHGSVVGASSLVNKDVEPDTIVAGVPARLLKNRG
jgi:acetyltransferase-like isoleucine patch superfamily enzyme